MPGDNEIRIAIYLLFFVAFPLLYYITGKIEEWIEKKKEKRKQEEYKRLILYAVMQELISNQNKK